MVIIIRKNHFIPCDEQTKSGNFTTKIRKFFRFHCVRAASNPFRLVLDTVTPLTAVHGSPRPLYPSNFKCAPAFTPVRSRDLPGRPGCAHGSSWGLLLYKVKFVFRAWMSIIILNRPVFHFVFHFVFQMRRTSDDAPNRRFRAQTPLGPPPSVVSASVWYCKGRWRFGYSRSLFNESGSRHDTMYSDAAAWNCPS